MPNSFNLLASTFNLLLPLPSTKAMSLCGCFGFNWGSVHLSYESQLGFFFCFVRFALHAQFIDLAESQSNFSSVRSFQHRAVSLVVVSTINSEIVVIVIKINEFFKKHSVFIIELVLLLALPLLLPLRLPCLLALRRFDLPYLLRVLHL